jgi:hypothetical protein
LVACEGVARAGDSMREKLRPAVCACGEDRRDDEVGAAARGAVGVGRVARAIDEALRDAGAALRATGAARFMEGEGLRAADAADGASRRVGVLERRADDGDG